MKTINVCGINLSITDDYKKYTRDILISLYWHAHPRFNYVKNCKKDSVFFDIGANNGGLSCWKNWEFPERKDIQMHGADLSVGKYSKKYKSFNTFNLDEDEFPYEDNFFDTMFLAHVIEHLKNPEFLADNVYKKLKTGGTIYVEAPAKATLNTPTMKDFDNAGFHSSTMNFYDDNTHIAPYDAVDLINIFEKNGRFKVLQSGTITNDFLADLLISYGYEKKDGEMTTYGLWLKFGWSNHIIAKKI